MDPRFRTFVSALQMLEGSNIYEELTPQDFSMEALQWLNIQPRVSECLFLAVDQGRRGRLTLVEFVQAVRRARPMRTLPHLRCILQRKLKNAASAEEAFLLLDPVCRGAVNQERFVAWLGSFGVLKSDARRLFGLLDINGDGEASWAEFLDELWSRRRSTATAPRCGFAG